MTSETVTIDGKQYTLRLLASIEMDTIIDAGQGMRATDRKLLAASLGMSEEEVGKIDGATRGRLSIEFSRMHSPKPLDSAASKKSETSVRP